MMLLPLFLILTSNAQLIQTEPYEVRIYEGATAGSKMTMSESLERRLVGFRNCFGQLETNVSWLDFDSEKWIFESRETVYLSMHDDHSRGSLRLLCAANKMHSLNFRVHITRKNRHPPQFSKPEYHFHLPVNLHAHQPFGTVDVIDHDPVIYNSQVHIWVLSSKTDTPIFDVHRNGSLMLKSDASSLSVFKPLRYTILAIDFGSPQLYSTANLTVIPVSVSEVRELSVNVATKSHQIFQWENSEHGIAKRFVVTVFRSDVFVYEREVDGSNNIAYFKIALEEGQGYSVVVTAVDVDGETPSEPLSFAVINAELECSGDCSEGGTPICYQSRHRRIEQYRDSQGPHCSCYQGFSGSVCDLKERCSPETTVDVFGHVDWKGTAVNGTSSIPCPFGAEGDHLTRICLWDTLRSVPIWQPLSADETCRKQSSVLIHLGVIGNYVGNANSVSSIETVYRFIGSLLKVPAFQRNITNVHFDTRIAEHVMQVFDAVISHDWNLLKGNTTQMQMKMFSLIDNFSQSLPIASRLASVEQGVVMQTVQRLPQEQAFSTMVSPQCGIEVQPSRRAERLRVVCLRNSTLQPLIDDSSPLLIVHNDLTPHLHRHIQLRLKPFTDTINFTCVRYDPQVNGWTTAHVEVVSPNKEGFVVCDSQRYGTFSLLPQSMFTRSRYSPLGDISVLLPLVTSVMIIIICLFLHLASIYNGRSIEPMLPLLFLLVLLLHFVQLLVLISPSFIEYLFNYDPHLSLTLRFLLLTASMLIAYISYSVHSKLVALTVAYSNGIYTFVKLIIIFTALIAIPIVLTVASYIFDGANGSECTLKVCTRVMLFTLYVPMVVIAMVILGYCICTVRKGLTLRRRLRCVGEKGALSGVLMRVSLCAPVVLVVLLCDTLLFMHDASLVTSLLLSASHMLLALFLVVLFASFLSMNAYAGTHMAHSATRSLERKRDISRSDLLLNAPCKNNLSNHCPFASISADSPTSLTNHMFYPHIFTSPEAPIITVV